MDRLYSDGIHLTGEFPAGRLEYETQTRQAAGTTNLYKTQYAYSYIAAASGGGRQLVRTEQAYSGGAWVNDNKLTYQHDALGRQNYEERHDWAAGAWSNRYDTTQSYDKNGNRTGYDHNVAGGYTTSYGRAANLSYTFNAVNQLTALTDADDAHYNATVSCDANNNITSVVETYSTTAIPPVVQSTLTTDFSYDALNRMTEHKTTRYDLGAGKTHYTIRDHTIDALGRVAKSSYSAYYQGDMPSVSNLEHVYAGANHVQNYDGTSAYGAVWHWAGSANAHGAPLNSPNPDTASQKGYNIAAMGGKNTPQRRSWLSPSSEGNKREIYGQGRPQAKDSSGNGANWYLGTVSNPAGGGSNVESRFFFEGTVSATDMSRATDAREASRIGIFGTSNSYGGSYGRVTNEALGRDLNPLGRGGGQALVAGILNVGKIAPSMPKAVLGGGAQGSSVNNPCSATSTCDGRSQSASWSAGERPGVRYGLTSVEVPANFASRSEDDTVAPLSSSTSNFDIDDCVDECERLYPDPKSPDYRDCIKDCFRKDCRSKCNEDYAEHKDWDRYRACLRACDEDWPKPPPVGGGGGTQPVPVQPAVPKPCNAATSCCCGVAAQVAGGIAYMTCMDAMKKQAWKQCALACAKTSNPILFAICMALCLLLAFAFAHFICCSAAALVVYLIGKTKQGCSYQNAWSQCMHCAGG